MPTEPKAGTARRARRRGSTATSGFGVGRREGHDSSAFYARFEPPHLSDDTAVARNRPEVLDRLFHGDARAMTDVADNSVALVVTSPPYFVGKDYEDAVKGAGVVPERYVDYLRMLEGVFRECVRVLEPGGRLAVNVANLGRKPYRSLSSDILRILQDELHLLLRGEIVWVKARAAGGSCAWGTFRQPANPVLRDLTERVIIASKGRFDRALKVPERAARGLPHVASVGADEFLEATTDVWELAPESAVRVGHPAPFPVELPQRLIELYTYQGDVVLDPFMGSGTAAVAAVRTGRHYIGYDTDPGYVAAARERVDTERAALTVAPTAPRDGRGVKELAAELLQPLFADVAKPYRPRGLGLSFDFGALDAAGERWLFDVVIGQTASRAGLRRAESLWRAAGKAAVVGHASRGERARVVVLSSDVPEPASAAGKMLAAVCAFGDTERWRSEALPLYDVIDVASDADRGRLAARVAASGPPG